MQYGAIFPQYEIGPDPAVIRDFAQAVEGMGYNYLTAYDHVIGANPDRPGGWSGRYDVDDAFHEVFVLFGYLAAVTQSIELVTGILIAPQRQTVLAAKQAAEVDVLSGGRLRLGVAIGWNKIEFVALGEDFHKRGRRIEEQVEMMRALWTAPFVTFEGDHERVDNAGIKPLPVQQPIPVWFGGHAEVALERIARMGDGWMPSSVTLEKGKHSAEILHTYLEKHGRSRDDFGIDIWVKPANFKNEDEWIEYIEGWKPLGATHVCFNTLDAGYKTVDEHLKAIERFKALAGF